MFPSLARSLRTEIARFSAIQNPVAPRIAANFLPELTMAREQVTKKKRCSLPAVLMRAGTSKGLFIHRHHLPGTEAEWRGPLLAAMGSQNSDARQIDGVGGATSTTSKVAVVSPSTRPGVDVDYTFVQVAVGKDTVDFNGNCGNMCSGVGPFALQEGLVHAKPGERTLDIRIFNTNTSRLIIDTVQVDVDGSYKEEGDFIIPGVQGTGSEIKVAFIDPSGSMTGKLFPTGRRSDTIVVNEPGRVQFSVRATLIDAANPFVVVDESTLPYHLRSSTKESAEYLDHMESIRRAGAVMMGLAPSIEAAAESRGTPKLAIVSPPSSDQMPRDDIKHDVAAINVRAFSMGKLHPSLQLTGAACLGSAVCIEGTVAHRVASSIKTDTDYLSPTPERTPSPILENCDHAQQTALASHLLPARKTVRISHQSGSIAVEVLAASSDVFAVVDRCIISRTARRLFEGKVYYYQ